MTTSSCLKISIHRNKMVYVYPIILCCARVMWEFGENHITFARENSLVNPGSALVFVAKFPRIDSCPPASSLNLRPSCKYQQTQPGQSEWVGWHMGQNWLIPAYSARFVARKGSLFGTSDEGSKYTNTRSPLARRGYIERLEGSIKLLLWSGRFERR